MKKKSTTWTFSLKAYRRDYRVEKVKMLERVKRILFWKKKKFSFIKRIVKVGDQGHEDGEVW